MKTLQRMFYIIMEEYYASKLEEFTKKRGKIYDNLISIRHKIKELKDNV